MKGAIGFPGYPAVGIAVGSLLACGYEGDVSAAAAGQSQAVSAPSAVLATGMGPGCPPANTTTYASHVTAQVSWPDNLALKSGRATMHIWMKATLSMRGDTITGTARPCGHVLPDIQTTFLAGGRKLGTIIPPSVWDAPAMPQVPVTGTQTGFDIGSSLSIDRTITLVGLTLPNPAAQWPTSYLLLPRVVDSDGDGKPGITLLAKQGPRYQLPKLGIFTSAHADRIYVASRTILSLQGKRDTCNTVTGTAVIEHFDNHIVGCHVRGGGDCDRDQTGFLDDNRVRYIIRGARFRSVKVAASATCADVRAAVP